MQSWVDRVALITGAGSNLAQETVKLCLARGMKLILTESSMHATRRLENRWPHPSVAAWTVDLSRPEEVEGLAARVQEDHGRLDCLLHLDRLAGGSTAWETSWDDWDRLLKGNLWTAVHLLRSILPLMLNSSGRIVTLVDPCGFGLEAHASAPFQTCQGALLALWENLSVALELRHHPLTAAVLCSGSAPQSLAEQARQLVGSLDTDRFYHFPPGAGWESALQLRLQRILTGPTRPRPRPDWKDRVAVITGAAGGIGQAMSGYCLAQGMKVVMADLPERLGSLSELSEVSAERLLRVPTDVSQPQHWEDLAKRTLSAFGAVHFLANNAGVGAGTTPWETSLKDWEWVVGVNLRGVMGGLKVFAPLIQQASHGVILNTASAAGLLAYHPSCCYQVTKAGIIALSEQVSAGSFSAQGSLSVLCPGNVNTGILDCESTRPVSLSEDGPKRERRHVRVLRAVLRRAMSPQELVEKTFAGLAQGQTYLLTHPEMVELVKERVEDMVAGTRPRNSSRLR